MPIIPKICINSQASNNLQLLSDAPETEPAKGKHSSTFDPDESREGILSTSNLKKLRKVSFKDFLLESKASVQAKCHAVKYVFKYRISRSQLFPAKVQQSNNVPKAKVSTIPTLDINLQAKENP